ncbi:aldo/keto reductase [Actinoplanes lobatus]|uniref:Aldo/keto reductase n=1 Tax=Actinoplanes lobatus TaxID=113568 RepID=A0A7W7MH61_9ACTN|nr:aldo/keto reductase [Actinoplanes lobatus]MBB4750124.1 aryl-alcohol dehydrogenase-like predicted oxidoreductase [Actinoplanes lobatus]GGN75294.1 aldo/keto reductase [Actinoplanes lobatus]GIE38988.1 aldo/keto reductase [Actinoplanes lobatus]
MSATRIATVELGRTGEQVSSVALGAMQMGNATGEASSVRILDRYRELGGSFVDTADCYEWWSRRGSRGGESEELLGRWMRDRGNRDEIFLATKGSALPAYSPGLWQADGTADWELARRTFAGAGADTLRHALDGSLKRLGTDHVDLYYVHVDDRATPLEETLEALAGLVAAGKVRYLGWSNVRTWRLERIRQLCDRYGWPAPVAVQQQHTYLRRRAGLENASIVDDEQWDYLTEHRDLGLVAYSPILKGVYDDAARRAGHWTMASYTGPDSQARLAALAEVADEVGATPNQTVLAWHLHQAAPTVVPLIGPRTPEQFENLVPALDVKLDSGQLARLDAAGA